jgi:hypothetical protein
VERGGVVDPGVDGHRADGQVRCGHAVGQPARQRSPLRRDSRRQPVDGRFSDEGAPNTWGANNYVDLTPGDGEQIMGLAVWREALFVFKESRFFVFYGTSSDSTGNPDFLFNSIEATVGPSSSKAIAVGRDGVYFLNQRGIYRTTGNTPELVSELLDPFFYGGTSDFYLSGTLNQAACLRRR